MVVSFNGQQKPTLQNFSVETVRNLLQLENKEIARLCAQVSLMPKKDKNGKMYFSREDIDLLRKVKNQKARAQQAQQTKSVPVSVPTKPQMPKMSVSNFKQIQNPPAKQQPNQNSKMAVEKICSSIATMETNLADKITQLIEEKLSKKLDEKLDGMDEVVVELVRCKTENETLRYKMNELNKELYNLKNELSRYKELGFGVYIKSSGETLL